MSGPAAKIHQEDWGPRASLAREAKPRVVGGDSKFCRRESKHNVGCSNVISVFRAALRASITL